MNFTTQKGIKDSPRRICVYGPPGIGKTTFAAGCPGVIVLDLEEGSDYLNVERNQEPIRKYEELEAWLNFLLNGEHQHKAVVIDTVDKLEWLLQRHICEENGVTSIEDVKKGYGKGYTVEAEEFRKLFNHLDMIRRKRGMDVILLAHAKLEKVPNPNGPEFQAWTLKCHKDPSAVVFQSCDIVMFAAMSIAVTKNKAYGDEKYRAVGDGARTLHTVGTPSYFAKNRCGLPPEIELAWTKFEEAYALGKQPDHMAQSIRAKLGSLNDLFKSSDVGAKFIADVQGAIGRAGGDTQKLIQLMTWMDTRLQKIDEEVQRQQQQQQQQQAQTV